MTTIRLALAATLFTLAPLAAQQRRAEEAAPPPAAQQDNQPQAGQEPIDFEKARGLMQKRNRGERLSAEEEAYLQRAIAARRGQQAAGRPMPPAGRPAAPGVRQGGREKVGFTPISEMTADDRYKGQDGGLYGGGKNVPPPEHARSAAAALARIQPLNAEGMPSPQGTIGFVSISMSNATQEFSTFKRIADSDPAKSRQVTIVDCAQGGQAMAEWVDPDGRPWQVAMQRLAAAGVSPEQVQVAWIKLANKGPRGDLDEHGRKLQRDTQAVIQNAKARFPNLQVAYLSSRIYGGYSGGPLNPEPYAYESGFVVRWLVQDQIKGEPELNLDQEKGPVKAPVLLWGPYLWADGVTPRKDGLAYHREDLAGDGTHPSDAGRQKVARFMLEFYKTDPLAQSWFAAGDAPRP